MVLSSRRRAHIERTWPASRVVERNAMVHRRFWAAVVSGVFEPIFYLFSIGIGVGGLVGDISVPGIGPVAYSEFVAPALLASSAMNGAVFEATFNVFHKLKWAKTYDAMVATPMAPFDIAIGELSFMLLRAGGYASAFLVVMLASGLVRSWWAVLVVPVAFLIGLAFGAVGMAATTFMRSWQDFDLVPMVTLPLFLFSATFYPLDVYPDRFQSLAQLSPLYHAAELVRDLTLGTVGLGDVTHLVVLAAMATAGLLVVRRRLARLLLP